MGKLSFEEKGLLRILEGIQTGSTVVEPTVRIALLRRGLIEPGEPASLSRLGEQFLEEFRKRRRGAPGGFALLSVAMEASQAGARRRDIFPKG